MYVTMDTIWRLVSVQSVCIHVHNVCHVWIALCALRDYNCRVANVVQHVQMGMYPFLLNYYIRCLIVNSLFPPFYFLQRGNNDPSFESLAPSQRGWNAWKWKMKWGRIEFFLHFSSCISSFHWNIMRLVLVTISYMQSKLYENNLVIF